MSNTDRHISEDILWLGGEGRFKFVVASESLTCSGASETTTDLVPDDVFLLGVCTRVTTAVTGATGYDVGDGSVQTRWGSNIGIALSSTSDAAETGNLPFMDDVVTLDGAVATLDGNILTITPKDVTITALGSNFTAGAVLVTAYYIQLVP